jgi:hypothetical protein
MYLDDLMVFSKSLEDHESHLLQVFSRLRDHGLVINLEKWVFGATSVDFLGHRVSNAGVRPLPAYVDTMDKFPRPTCVKELQAFLGLVNFYRRFLPAIAHTLRPLTDALKGSRKGTEVVQWSEAMDTAFASTKQALAKATLIAHPAANATLSLAVDASNSHVGACLQQRRPHQQAWEPLGFFSKKLEKAQTSYSAFDRELLACVSGIRHFRFML